RGRCPERRRQDADRARVRHRLRKRRLALEELRRRRLPLPGPVGLAGRPAGGSVMSRSNRIRVGMTYDLRDAWLDAGYSELDTAEFDRQDTIESIASALRTLGYDVDPIGHLQQLARRLVAGDRWDIVFNICEGMHGLGREAQVPALLDAYQVPYVFSD